MSREKLPERRKVWRQKVRITNADDGVVHVFYVEFGEYPDGRLGEVFVTSKRMGTFVRGVLDTLAQTISVSLQSGTSPHDLAATLRGQRYPPHGAVEAEGSDVQLCASISDYIAQEIAACYGPDGRWRPRPQPAVAAVLAGEGDPMDAGHEPPPPHVRGETGGRRAGRMPREDEGRA